MDQSTIFKTKLSVIIIRIVIVLISLGVLGTLLNTSLDSEIRLFGIAFFGTLAVVFTFLSYKSFNYRIVISDSRILENNVFSRNTMISWNDVKTVNIVMAKGLIRIKGSMNQIIISNNIELMDDLIETVIEKQGSDKINFGNKV